MTTEPPSFWDRSHVVWENAKHVGLPIINWLCGYKPRWTPAEMGSKAGQVILVTGANSGTGYATAQAYYNAGARVIMACRSEERANQAITEITSGAYRDINGTLQVPTTPPKTPGVLEFLALDLADLYSVEKAAKTLEKEKRLDVLFANAGIMAVPPAETKQGYALQFGTNVLGHQRLISRLLPLMQSTSNSTASPSRLIVSSSFAHLWAPKNGIDGGIAYDTLKGTGKLDKIKEYGESKWGGVALARYVDAHYGPGSARATFKDKQPLKTLARASKSCAAQSVAYGACVGRSYQEVHRDMCKDEFKAFKECVQKAVGRKW
ncbi:hypothetical protein CcaverHIS002_0601950 [Cutaneotrichosporon cavernicola]|nr:hypothetical protein CcaverHIS002_0601950 [Cutaneotrichosporon cavernicola]BEJ00351.1 hypothetical protein CcaverHIS631_0502080 [Cutaneotrichosporon cavernicola]